MMIDLLGNGGQPVRRLGAQERDEQLRLAVPRQEIAIGIEQADRGELEPFDPQGTLARVRARQSAGAGRS